MTITDLVFPAFLFIVGIAVPFALGGRLRRGQSRLEVWRHVVTRALALVVMGVLMVNAEHGVSGVLSAPVWNVLMTLGVLLVWGVPDDGWGRIRKPWLRAAGVGLLVFVALAYRGVDATGWIQLRPYWWGILGLIGWAYLGVASLYLLVGERPAVLTGLVALFGCVALADAAGGLGMAPAILRPLVGPVIGTHGAPSSRARCSGCSWHATSGARVRLAIRAAQGSATRPRWGSPELLLHPSTTCTRPSASARSTRPRPGASSPRPSPAPPGYSSSCWWTSGPAALAPRPSRSPARTRSSRT